MTLIHAYQSRGIVRDLTIQDADETTITPGANDKVRVSIGREGATAKLTVSSDAATANGSTLTKGATNRLSLVAADLAFDPGVYTLVFDYYDNADGQWKNISRQVFSLEQT